MKILFIHQNFPGQYLHLARHLSALGGHTIVGLGEAKNIKARGTLKGITTRGYATPEDAGTQTHHYLRGLEGAVRRGQTVARALLQMKSEGFTPDVVSLHPGWGEGLFVRDVFPDTPILMFCEYYFRAGEGDLAFDPEFPQSVDWAFSVRLRNSTQVMSLITADACISPTPWQASRYPDFIRERTRILHDGINTAFMQPDPHAVLRIQPMHTPGESRALTDAGQRADNDPLQPKGPPITLTRNDKVITYIARNLEPYRGFHTFLRALPDVQQRHPDARILIVGNDGVSYSPAPPSGESYKQVYLRELDGKLDLERIHFLGRIPYPVLRRLFQISSAHLYLTYPFVLSWSVLEAMACEAPVIASRTAPVEEIITHGENGLLFDFFDQKALVDTVCQALDEPDALRTLRANARAGVLERFRLEDCLDRQVALLEELSHGPCRCPR